MPVSCSPHANTTHSTQTFQVVRDLGGSGEEHSEDECDSDSDYEDAVEGTPVSVGASATLATGAFPT